MSEIALEFDHVWKKFKKGEKYDSLRDLIPGIAKRFFMSRQNGDLQAKEFWVIKDVCFQVERGVALGLIGPNGAGKSTMLKLFSGIMKPNKGQIKVNGRLSALIEVGAGFHPDLTGRENIFLNGTILGMRRDEIQKRLDEIIEFSGISEFIDTPVKRYSSGMYARLCFSIAVHVDPEILLVDEVLSVGDMWFQEKCLNKMLSIKDRGVTIIFVSHNLASINILCTKTAFLKGGQLQAIGPTSEVIKSYICSNKDDSDVPDGHNVIWATKLINEKNSETDILKPGERVKFVFKLKCSMPHDECQLGFFINRLSDGLFVCEYNLSMSAISSGQNGPVDTVVDFDANLLRGAYSISLYIYHYPSARNLVYARNVAFFSVEERINRNGVAHLNPRLYNPA